MAEGNLWLDHYDKNVVSCDGNNSKYKNLSFLTFKQVTCSIEGISDEFVTIELEEFSAEIPVSLIPERLRYLENNLIYFRRLYENGDLVRSFTHPPVNLDELAKIYLADR